LQVVELSNTVDDSGHSKTSWVDARFEQGSRTLKRPPTSGFGSESLTSIIGLYGYPDYLAEVEPQLIGLAYDAYLEYLLNHGGLPDDAPLKTREHRSEPGG
jgi:hypothetical protein